jgi:murein biosynthesis integral membrane protein MurJ
MSTPPHETPVNELDNEQLNNEELNKPVAPDVSISTADDALDEGPLDTETANALQTESTGRSVAKATAGIGAFHMMRLVIGFVGKPMIANRLGIKAEADVFAVASDIVTSLWRIFEKAVNPTFLPTFMQALGDEGEERAWRFTSTAVWFTLLALCLITPVVWFGMPWIVDLYSDKASPEQRVLTVAMARLMLSGLFFLGVSSLTYVILNGYKRFGAAAFGDTLWKAGSLLGAGFAVAMHLDRIPSLYAISIGFVVGAVLKLVPHLIALKSKWSLLRPRIEWDDPLLKKMLILSGPLLLGVFISEGRDIYIKAIADDPRIQVEGSRAALDYSRLIGTNLINIFPYALSIGIFPYLADIARTKQRQPLTDTLLGALRVCIFAFVPLTAILIALRFPLLSAVWESGQMKREDTQILALPFICYSLGLVGFSCEMILNQAFYAMTRVWTPTLIGLGTTVVWVLTARLGVDFGAAAGFGLAAIAIAESSAKTLKCFLMWFWLRPHLGEIKVREEALFWLKVIIGSLLAAAVAYALSRVLASGEIHSKMDKIKMLLGVALSGMGGVLAYFAFGALTRIREVQLVGEFAGKLKRRLSGK